FFLLPPPTEIYPLSLHDALPILSPLPAETVVESPFPGGDFNSRADLRVERTDSKGKNVVELLDFQITNPLFASRYISPESHLTRSEEHTSELQSRENLVCRLLLE